MERKKPDRRETAQDAVSVSVAVAAASIAFPAVVDAVAALFVSAPMCLPVSAALQRS